MPRERVKIWPPNHLTNCLQLHTIIRSANVIHISCCSCTTKSRSSDGGRKWGSSSRSFQFQSAITSLSANAHSVPLVGYVLSFDAWIPIKRGNGSPTFRKILQASIRGLQQSHLLVIGSAVNLRSFDVENVRVRCKSVRV